MQADCLPLPAPCGRLFVVSLLLRGDLRAGVSRLLGNGFLGGVLHGAVRSRWFDLTNQASSLHWRILVAPRDLVIDSGCDNRPGAVHPLQFGVLMHGGQPGLWHCAQQALESLTELTVGSLRVPVLSVRCLHRALPAGAALPLAKWDQGPDAEPMPPAVLALHWCTPLHLASRSKVEAGHGGAPPSLLGVVRSLRRRACLLEPGWAKALGLESEAWVAAEEALRPAGPPGHGATRHRMRVVAWRYGSRTKAAPFVRHGLMGRQVFHAPGSASLLGLLSLGAWLGVGEGASFGCGQFHWRLRLANGERAPALLRQPWSGVEGGLGLLSQNV